MNGSMNGVYIPDKKTLDAKIRAIRADGLDSLRIVSDFDMTLTRTKATAPGKIARSFDLLPLVLPPRFDIEQNALWTAYGPYESNRELSFRDRERMVSNWWSKFFDLAIKYRLNIHSLHNASKKYPLEFKDGCRELIVNSQREGIPFLIFSASSREIILGYMAQNGLLGEHMTIIANSYITDRNGRVTGYVKPLINATNKNEKMLAPVHRRMFAKKKNTILLGDLIGDASMAEENGGSMIKVGFLNGEVGRKKGYSSHYDVLVLQDGKLGYVNELLRTIRG